MSIEKRADEVLAQARDAASEVKSWADFSNRMFGPAGIVAKAFPSEMERQLFLDSRQHSEINGILLGLMKRHGVVNGATPKEPQKSVVRVAKTVHHSLEIEAKREGVSLNQLAATKLSVPLPRATNLVADIATEKREPATGIIDADGNQSSATNYPESPDSSLDGWMEQCRLFPNPNSELSPGPMLPEICIEIRSSTDGSSDPLPKAFLEKVQLMLIARLNQWGKRYEDVIDECVKRMCGATITIIEHELKSRIERGWDY